MSARKQWPVSSLLHPLYGSAAVDIRRACGISRDGRLADTMAKLELTRRAVVDLRGYRGDYLTTTRERITPDHQEMIHRVSSDNSILMGKGVSPHEHDMRVNPAILPEAGCTDAFNTVTNGTDEVVAEGCDTLELEPGCGIAIEKTGDKQFTISSTGVRSITADGVSCENECGEVNFRSSECGICFNVAESGPGETCHIEGRLQWQTYQGLQGEPGKFRICGCDGTDLIVTGFEVQSSP